MGSQKGCWVKVALQGAAIANQVSCLAKIRRPVEAHGISTSFCDGLKPLATTFDENNSGRREAVGFATGLSNACACALNILDNLFDVFLGEALEVCLRQKAAPAVKHHHGIGTRFDLHDQVVGHGLGNFFKQGLQRVGAAVEPLTHAEKIVIA